MAEAKVRVTSFVLTLTSTYPMESLNLHTLATSLPLAQQNAEKELANNFKAAALSLTNLYRASRENSKKAYNHGYATACHDLLTMIQQGVSLNQAGSSHDADGGGMTIGRVMDWIEARLEAIKSAEEEEEEDQQRENEKEEQRQKDVIGSTAARLPRPATALPSTTKEQQSTLPSPTSLRPQTAEPPTALRLRAGNRTRPTTTKVDIAPAPPVPSMDTFSPSLDPISPNTFRTSDIPFPISAGAKRRHAMMMMLDAGAAPPTSNLNPNVDPAAAASGGQAPSSAPVHLRRRVRNSKAANPLTQSQAVNTASMQVSAEAMDIEEEGGRERKRVARR